MDSARPRGFANQKQTISIVLAIAFAAVIASSYWVQRRDWLNRFTLEVQATSAPTMAMSTPSRGALWLKTASGTEELVRTKEWAGPAGRPFSALRFNFPIAAYEKAIFFPDPSLQEVEIVKVRLIPHNDERAIALSLEQVLSQQDFVTTNRTQDSVSFKRIGGNAILAINIQVTDLLKQIGPAESRPFLETALVFLSALLASYWCVVWLSLNSFGARGSLPDASLSEPPLARIGMVLGLIACMAAAAPDNSNPDEYLHVEAARYYMHHWLPPPVDNEWVAPSFSYYGLTYLAGIDIGYFFAGKFALIFQPVFSDIYVALRFFNVALFAVLLFWSARVFREWPITSLFFLTPQLWYVFSAYNTEGWALFISFLLVGQVVFKESSLHRSFRSISFQKAIRFLLPALLLSCLLLLSKRNFFLVALFFATWLVWQLITSRFGLSISHRALRIAPLILLPLLVRFGVQTYESAINKGDLPHAILQQAEKYAEPDFKPSVLNFPGKGFEGVNMRARGYTLRDVLIGHEWLSKTIASSYGTYGWMAFFSPRWFYIMMGLGWLIFMGCAIEATFARFLGLERVFCGIAWLFLPLIMMVSLFYSWTYDFQAQGRYLFPFLPILFYLVYTVRPGHRRFVSATVWVILIASAYGFIFFGLKALVGWDNLF